MYKEKSELKERDDSVFKFGAEARKTFSENSKNMLKERTHKKFKCEQCIYEYEQSCTSRKHLNIKHTEKKCKVCSQYYKTAMDLVSHVAQEHHEKEEYGNLKFENKPCSNKVRVSKSVKKLKVQLKKNIVARIQLY